jgi:protein-disulfide isomerase
MRCEEVREVIAEHLTGKLPADSEKRVQQHLADCLGCRTELEDLRTLWNDLGDTPVPEMQVSRLRATVLQAASTTVTPLGWRFEMKHILKAVAAILVLAALAAGAGLLLTRRTSTPAANVDATHIRGSATSPVVLMEYGDYECPPCASFDTVVRQYIEKHPDTLKFEFRHFPLTRLHPNALTAALAAEAAHAQGKFWVMHDALMDSQAKWARTSNGEVFFTDLARQSGLDMKLFSESLRSKEMEAHILAEAAEAQKSGIAGTPTLLLNGRKLEAAPRSVENLETLVLQELKRLMREEGKN